MSDKPDGGPAFPCKRIGVAWTSDDGKPHVIERLYNGMSLRAYAAIHLRVPDSGTPWLDDMIRQSLRQDFAKAALSAMCVNGYLPDQPPQTADYTLTGYAIKARQSADAMLAELAKKGDG